MTQPIELSTLRILNSKGQTIGTGFLVSKTLAVTCAHVVSSIGLDAENRIRVQFTGQKQPIYARVPDELLNLDRDVAILELESVLEGIQPLRLAPATSCRSGSDFRSFGYATAADVQGIHANGKIDGYLTEHKLLQLQSPQANHGISGGPVFDESRGVVVGMITKGHTELGRNAETTFATPAELLFEICPEIRPSETCPYLGLETFTAETARFFFGRESLTEKLVTTLRSGCRFLAVFGPSGSGKSSVVRAGLLPKLKDGLFADWKQVTLRPADNPFAQMQAAGLDSLTSLGGRALLFVDQFEELFTLCPNELREKFIGELAATLDNSRFLLIISMRDDFYSAFNAKAAPLAQSENLEIENVPGTLKREELVAMIERPAVAVGLALEQGLTELIIKDLTRDGDARSSTLPLLEFALMQLWEQRRDGHLTHDAYQSTGGVTGSLARWADEAYSDLPKSEQPLAESLLTSLVHLGDEAQGLPDTRKRRALAEFDESTQHVVKHFTDRRLLVTGGETVELVHDALVREWGRLQDWLKQNREQLRILEVVSEAAKAWSAAPQNPDLLVHRGGRLDDALSQKHLNAQERAYLNACATLRNQEKDMVERRRRSILMGVSAVVMTLIAILAGWGWTSKQSSIQMSYQVATADIAKVEAESAKATAESARAVAVKEGDMRAKAQANAEEQAKIAHIGELLAQSVALRGQNFPVSTLLGIEVYKSSPNIQSYGALLDNVQTNAQLQQYLYGHTESVNSIAFSPNGKIIASGSGDKTIILWDTETHQTIGQPLTGHTKLVSSIAFSPDGKILASSSCDNTIILWNLENHQPIGQPLIGHTDCVNSVAFSPDGKILASGSRDNTVILWEVESQKQIDQSLVGHTNWVQSVAFSPNGKMLASGSDDQTIILWDIKSHQPIGQPLVGHTKQIDSASFSPDGKMLASGSRDKNIILWDVENHQPIGQLLTGHTDFISSVTFSPDGKTLASGAHDNTIILWNIETHLPIGKPLTGHTYYVSSVAFSPDGKLLVSGGGDNAVILWNIDTDNLINQPLTKHKLNVFGVAFNNNGKILASGSQDGTVILWNVKNRNTMGEPLVGHTDSINCVAFSPDGETLASGSDDQTIILWDVKSHQPIGLPLNGHAGVVWSVVISPNGKILAAGYDDNIVILWNINTHQEIGRLKGHNNIVYSVAFSPDGKVLASGSWDNTIILWDVASGQPIGEPLIGHTHFVSSVAFSPNGKMLASGSWDNTIIIWDVASHRSIGQPLAGHADWANSVAFSPDGKILASGNGDKTITLWDVEKGQPIGQPLSGPSELVDSIVFSPDGATLASSSWSKTILLWDFDPKSWVKKSCQRVGRNFTRTEWAQYFPNEEYRATCPQWPIEPEPTATP